ncbi:MAG: hypothetical protein ACYTGH_20220, partial [Planctomycetota bacterium]
MHIPFSDFVALHARAPELQALAFLKREGGGRYQMVQQGDLFNRSEDQHYVIDNLQNRVTHVEMDESRELILTLQSAIEDSLHHSTIDVPPGDCYLMQDIYQLPDTGDWKVGTEVEASELKVEPPVTQHALVDLHDGVVIDNILINLLRSRTSYMLEGEKYIRTRDAHFLVRRRTQQVVVVVDDPAARAEIETVMQPHPDYAVIYYVLTEQGIKLAELDRGDREHVGLIRYIKENSLHPDMVLFPAHRTVQMEKARSAILVSQERTGGTTTLRRVVCGQLPALISEERVVETIRSLMEGPVVEEEAAPDTGNSIRIKRNTGELNFSYRHLILQFRYVCQLFSFDEGKIAELLQPAQHQA